MIDKKTVIEWQRINAHFAEVQKFKVQNTEILTDDNFLTFSIKNQTVPIINKDGFQYDYNEGMLAGISIMMSLDKMVFTRRVYSMGDWMNEIGGYS